MLILSKEKIADFCLPNTVSISDAMIQIDRNARRGIIIISDSNKVLGIVTDGDIRRSLMRGVRIESSVGDIINMNFRSVIYQPENSLSERIKTCLAKYPEIEILPVVDSKMNLKGIEIRRN